jgi:hypothetical protein
MVAIKEAGLVCDVDIRSNGGDVRQFEDEMMFLPIIIALYRAVETTRVGIHLFTVSQTDIQSL